MPLPDDLSMRLADERDLPVIGALRESVGWSTHEWALRAVLRPSDKVRCFVVTERDGRVVGVGSGVAYGALGFVGNMIVSEDQRRRGVGSAVLAAILDFLDGRGCTRIELFATSEGRPLYARHGFALTDPSGMATVPRDASLEGDPDSTVEISTDATEVARYDAPRFGGDRGELLAAMAADRDRPLLVARRDAGIVGYLWLRADGHRVGPFVADSPQVAAALLREAFGHDREADGLTLNLPTSNVPGRRWLEELGVEIDPWDGRMARGPAISRRDETIYANAVGALG